MAAINSKIRMAAPSTEKLNYVHVKLCTCKLGTCKRWTKFMVQENIFI